MREIVKLGGILFLIAAISAGILAFSNNVTKDKIIEAEEAASSGPEVASVVIPGSVGFEKIDDDSLVDKIKEENVKFIDLKVGNDENGNTIGYAIRTSSPVKGYAGDIEIYLGVSLEGEIVGMKVLSLSETPGLGSNVQNADFQEQFFGKNADMQIGVSKGNPAENEIVAVSGATYSSRSITSAVNNALDIYNQYLKK